MTQWLLAAVLALVVGLVIGFIVGRRSRARKPCARAADETRRESQSRDAILSALARAARMLFGAEGNDQVMPSALEALGKAVAADRVYVFENHHDPDDGSLLASQRYEWCREGIPAEIDNPDMLDMSYDELLPNWRPLFESREPVVGLVEDMQAAERALLGPQKILSILVVPIFLDGQFWGLIGFDDCSTRRVWGQAEIDALEVAAGTIGGAIRSMRAEEELRHLVSTDSLTGLSSRRAFLERARSLIEQARGAGQPLSLLLMDLDHFKKINDTHGHPAGDQALVAFASICREVLRDDDLIGRTGGEEFAVVLRETDCHFAVQVAEKLRQRVAGEPIATDRGQMGLSVSIGVATLGAGERDLSHLFHRADEALYSAKRAGRNRVESQPAEH